MKRASRSPMKALTDCVSFLPYLDKLDIDPGGFSRFMNGHDNAISFSKLKRIDESIKNDCISILVRFYGFEF